MARMSRPVTPIPSLRKGDFSMGFKNAWKLGSRNSPLLDINLFFFSTKGEATQNMTMNWVFCCVWKSQFYTVTQVCYPTVDALQQ